MLLNAQTMKRKTLIWSSLVITLLSASCGKDDDQPQPGANSKGSLNVIVSPAEAATRINIIRGTDTIKAYPDAYGVFEVKNLPENNYNVVFTPSPFYKQPAGKTAQIKAGQQTDFGTINFDKKQNGVLHKVNGTVMTDPYSVTYNEVKPGNLINIRAWNYGRHGIDLVVPFAVGKYESSTSQQMTWSYSGAQGGPSEYWGGEHGGKATVTITKIDQVAKTISGTFSFTAQAAPGSSLPATISITDGTFIETPIR
jgi:hypothetical protein